MSRSHERIIDLEPRAQEIIKRFLKPDMSAFILLVSDAAEARRQFRHEHRETPLTWGNVPADDDE